MEIKVLGPGCPKCKQTEKVVNEAVAEAGVFGTPAVVVDGEVKSVGKIPTKADVVKWLKK